MSEDFFSSKDLDLYFVHGARITVRSTLPRDFDIAAARAVRWAGDLARREALRIGGAIHAEARAADRLSTIRRRRAARDITRAIATMPAWHRRVNPAWVSGQAAVELAGAAPVAPVLRSEVCDACGRPMVILIEGALAGCPHCEGGRVRAIEPRNTQADVALAASATAATAALNGTNRTSRGARAQSDLENQETRLRDALAAAQAQSGRAAPARVTALQRFLCECDPPMRAFVDRFGAAIGEAYDRDGPFASFDDARRRLPAQATRALVDLVSPEVVRGLRVRLRHPDHAAMLERYPSLRALAREKSFEDAPAVAKALTGVAPPQMPRRLVQQICRLFRRAEPVYATMSGKRHFWGGYKQFIVRACRLLGYDEFVPLFPCPNVRHCEDLCRRIWQVLDWEYQPMDQPPPAIQYVAPAAPAEDSSVALPPPRDRVAQPISARRNLRMVCAAPKPLKTKQQR